MTTHTEAALRGDLELLNRTVAELVGWRYHGCIGEKLLMWPPSHGDAQSPPDFTGSLDACRTFEAGFTKDEQDKYQAVLKRIAHHKRRYIWELEPQDHCIAFCYLRNVITSTTPQ